MMRGVNVAARTQNSKSWHNFQILTNHFFINFNTPSNKKTQKRVYYIDISAEDALWVSKKKTTVEKGLHLFGQSCGKKRPNTLRSGRPSSLQLRLEGRRFAFYFPHTFAPWTAPLLWL